MMEIHQHPSYKLGWKPIDPDRKVLRLRWHRGIVPTVPPRVDYFGKWTIGLDMNNRYGLCGPCSVDNHRRLTTTLLTGTEVDADINAVFDLYRRSGNPAFDPLTGAGDNGVDMATMLQATLTGGFAGVMPLGYAKLSDKSDTSLMAAIDIFGGVLLGVLLQTSQQAQTDHGLWDYARSGTWGGHAVLAASYDKANGQVDVATWGKRCGCTSNFRRYQLNEVWIPLWPELLTAKSLYDIGVDVATLAADYLALTGRPFPVPVPMPPAPLPPAPGQRSRFVLEFDGPPLQNVRVVA